MTNRTHSRSNRRIGRIGRRIKGGNFNGAAPYAQAVYGDALQQHVGVGNVIASNNPFAVAQPPITDSSVSGGKRRTHHKRKHHRRTHHNKNKISVNKSMKNFFSWFKK